MTGLELRDGQKDRLTPFVNELLSRLIAGPGDYKLQAGVLTLPGINGPQDCPILLRINDHIRPDDVGVRVTEPAKVHVKPSPEELEHLRIDREGNGSEKLGVAIIGHARSIRFGGLDVWC